LGPAPIPYSEYEFDVFYRNQELKGLKARQEPNLDSMRFSLEAGRVPDGTDFMLTLAHGMGAAETSHSGTTAPWIRTLYGLDKQGKRIHREWQERGRLPMRIASEAFDLPEAGHGAGPTDIKFGKYRSLRETFARFAAYQGDLKTASRSSNAKYGWMGQSSSTELITQLNRFYPDAMDYMILIGPLHRDPKMGFQHSYDLFQKEANLPTDHKDYFAPNWAAFHWVNRMYYEMPKFIPNEDPSGGKPMLVLVGENDKEVSDAARAYYRGLSEKHSNIVFGIVPGAGHSVLTSSRGYDPTYAYTLVMEFLDSLRQ
jgi:hypothetical protein